MRGHIVSLVVLAVLLVACAPATPPAAAPEPVQRLKGCDDGGEEGGASGVVLNGVCF